MKQKARTAGFGVFGNKGNQQSFRPNSKGNGNDSDVSLLVTPTHPCAVCGQSTHGWGTVEGGRHVCGKKCHDEFQKNQEVKIVRKKVELIAGPDGIMRPANLPKKDNS